MEALYWLAAIIIIFIGSIVINKDEKELNEWYLKEQEKMEKVKYEAESETRQRRKDMEEMYRG